MNYDRQIQGSFWLMIAIQVIGAVDMPGKGARKLPAPRAFVVVIVMWAILGLIADAGAGKAAAVMGWITVLTGAVIGPFGNIGIGFLNTIANKFGVQPGGNRTASSQSSSLPDTGTQTA